LPRFGQLRFRLGRRKHIRNLHGNRQEAHRTGQCSPKPSFPDRPTPCILHWTRSNRSRKQTTYKLTLTNVADGVDSLVNAKPPVGTLTIAGKWRVQGGMLTEDVVIDGNFMMKKVAKGNVEKTHPEQHAKLLEAASA
jgi:hypothetical protein